MKIREIYKFLDELSPFELQEKWDNSGLQIGNFEDEFQRVYISLDLDEELLSKIENNSLIITHHPLIFSPLKNINFDNFATKMIKELIKKDICLISMHTNFDKTHLNKYVLKEILGLEIEQNNEYICYAKVDISFDEFLKTVQNKLEIDYKKIVKCHENIKSVALVTGSGMSLLDDVKADCFLTGDIKYHDAMEAKSRQISLIDIGHYESEKYFTPLLLGLLSTYLKKNKIQAIMSNLKNPFCFK